MAIVEIRGVGVVRAGRRILRDISWSIGSGEHWALLGANGSGKTTLLRVLTGYEWPTEGEVRVLGKRLGACDAGALRRAIGWASSSLAARVHGSDTVLEVIASGFAGSIGLYRPFTPREWREARRVLRVVGLPDLADQPWERCSQGEQQRTLIARALVHRPRLVILDEPCAGLDPVAREALHADLARMARHRGAPTVILVTHHIEEIGPWMQCALVLRSGRVLAAGPVAGAVTGPVMSRALGRRCRVSRTGGRLSLVWTE